MATNGNSSSNNGDHPRSANGYMKIVAVGNLGRDPEMRYTPSGKAVTNFSLAINLRTYDPEAKEQVVPPHWLRVSTWDKNAETCNRYLKQGSRF